MLHRSVAVHENIIRLYGITKVEAGEIQKYSLVLEYADSGSLNTYLDKHFNELNWNDKSRLASQLASAVEFLHNSGLNHCDLHGNSVLIHQKNIKLADFECWEYEPNERPNIQEVSLTLKATTSLDYKGKKVPFSLEKYKSNLELSMVTMDINNDLKTTNSLMSNIISNINAMPSLNTMSNICESRISPQNHLDSSSITSGRESFSSINLIESIYNEVADILINYIIKKHDEGITFDQVQELIDKKMLQLNQNLSKLIDWLSKNQDESKYIWFLGLFYYYNFGIEMNNNIKAFELFSKAANNNYLIAQVYLAKYYYDGYGINYDYKMVFDLLGRGVDKDEIKAFKYYEMLANQETSDAQLELGNCLYNGIGTRIDKIQAKYWYEKAANKGNIIAKSVLKMNYNRKTRIEIENSSKHKLYKILFFKNLSQLEIYYVGKLLLKSNYKKSFYYLQKAAENGCKCVQLSLGKCYQLGTGVRKDNENILAYDNLAICYELGIGVDKDKTKAFEIYEKSAEKGYVNTKFHLGYCYVNGIGTKINKTKGFELYNETTEKGNNNLQPMRMKKK
ncbi:hypothetical protein RclHR1_05290010 [Rhizophagus clarus]|uniref:Protein kinase domain-containing protein n=1 Tax=Rhizophagus clarus TaxID=94130 RepID=A0A2Z6S4W1_9GLOM|nr:hypothetical protein RclHR1_05290010 [Rhizophagus clarus]